MEMLAQVLAEPLPDYAKLCILFTTCLQRLNIVRETVESSADLAPPKPRLDHRRELLYFL